MSKPVKELIRKELTQRLTGVTSLAIVGFSGLNAEATHVLRGRLADKDIHLHVVKNSLARQAFRDVGLDSAVDLLDGPCAVAYGTDPNTVGIVTVVRELLDIKKDSPAVEVKAAVLDGDVFSGADDVDRLSKYPTRDEAIGQIVTCALSSGANLSACLIAPGGAIGSLLEAIENDAEAEAEADAPEASAPEVAAPEADAPEAAVPEADAPEADVPEASAPEASAPEADAAEASAPEVAAPEADAPEADAPKAD